MIFPSVNSDYLIYMNKKNEYFIKYSDGSSKFIFYSFRESVNFLVVNNLFYFKKGNEINLYDDNLNMINYYKYDDNDNDDAYYFDMYLYTHLVSCGFYWHG